MAVLVTSSALTFAQKLDNLTQQSAEKWLALVDVGNYAESCRHSASLFKFTSPRIREHDSKRARSLGKLMSRKLNSAQYTKTLPGVPDGDYVAFHKLIMAI
jgi:hypothetical protein